MSQAPMTTADKFGIAFSIGFTVALIAIAMSLSTMSESPAPVTRPPPPAPVPEPVVTPQPTGPTKTPMIGYDRLTSIQDPGIGHESHQLAIILAPSDEVYSGTLMYDASEPIQLVALTGPLAPGKDMGQPIWTPDGKTKFALTLVDPKNSRGEWKFVGNALAVHTMKTTPFTVSYSVSTTATSTEPVPVEEPTAAPMSAKVSIPSGNSLPGCEETNECYIPYVVTISVGGTVTWTNDDTAVHTVTSGTLEGGGPDGIFDSSIIMTGKTFEHTFDEAGTFDYFCTVHPWMPGQVVVE